MQAFLARHSQQPWYPDARKTWDEWTDRVLAADEAGEVDAMMAKVLPLYTADPDRPGVRAMIEELVVAGTPVGKLTVAPVPTLVRHFELTPDR